MTQRHLMVLAAALATLSTIPVFADWETTRWGMSPDETLAALDGARSHNPVPAEIYEDAGKNYAPLVKLSYTIEGRAGEVSLLYDSQDKLHFVLFNPTDIADCDALASALIERHGKGDALGAGAFSISEWSAEGDAIKLTNVPTAGICNLSYSAR